MRDFKGMKRQRGRNRGGGGPPSSGKPQQNANRAFDSAGPENVKVRGHAQSVYEKYQQLARDAFQSGDRILAEGYLQHAEHYFRLLRLIQPNRPTAEIVARDVFASGFDIDFEEEPDFSQANQAPEPEAAASYPQADGGETGATAGDEGQGEGARERPRYDNRDRNQGDRFQNDRYNNDRNQGDRGQADRGQGGDRAYADRGQNGSNGDRYQGGGRGQNDRYPADRPQGDRGFQGDRAQGDRVQADRPQGDRPQGDRNQGDRNQGGRERYDRERPRDDRPREDRQGQDRFRGGEGRRDERPYAAQGEPRAERPYEARGDRPERTDRQERPERGERPDRGERRDRGFERSEGGDRTERSAIDSTQPQAADQAPPPRNEPSSASPRLRSEDGGFSEAPAFLQAAMPVSVPAAPDVSSDEEAPAPRPRRTRARRRAETDDAGESSRTDTDASGAAAQDAASDGG